MIAKSPRDDLHDWIPTDRAGRALLKWTRLLAAHRWLLAAILILQAILFSSFSAWIAWQPDVLQFFSANSAEVRNIREASQKSSLANQLRFDVHITPQSPDNPQAIAAATRQLAAALQSTGQFHTVWTGINQSDLVARYANLLPQAPLFLSSAQRVQVEQHLTPQYLNQRFAAVKARLADPDGEFLAHQLAADPLNLNEILSTQLQSLSPVKDATASLHDNLLMIQSGAAIRAAPVRKRSEPEQNNLPHENRFLTGAARMENAGSRWHAMIVTDPISLPSNQKAAEKTLAAADAAVASLTKSHPQIGVWTVGAHRGYVENAHQIITDVSRVSLLGTLAVALAIALYFRRVSTALLCMIPPVVGVGLALGFAGIFHVTLPLLLLGFAGLLCGSTTDYGIQLIAEARRLCIHNAAAWHPDIPAAAARRMLGPISMSVATSVTGFAALLLSSAPGLRAMGAFVAAATVSIWLVTFLILPACLGPWILPRKKSPAPSAAPTARSSRFSVSLKILAALLFLAATIAMFIGALHARFTVNPQSLDGSSPALLSDENNFAKVWGDPRNHAIVLVHGTTPDEALTALTHVTDYLADQKRDGLIAGITSPAAILPAQSVLQKRAAAWAQFWSPEKRAQLQTNLAAAATANGFKPAAFTHYADHIAENSPEPAAVRLVDSPAQLFPGFVEQPNIAPGLPGVTPPTRSITLATLVQMRSDVSLRRATAWGPELRARFPGTIILSGNMLFFDATERARAEGERLLPLCILAILLPLLLYFRRLTRAWLALTCLLVGLIWVLGAADFFGGLNLLALVPMMFTLGVAVDYGIYLSTQPPNEKPRLGATALGAFTTILGTGALLLAGHPAMRWLGITLVAGITGGILAAIFLVCPIATWSRRRSAQRQLGTGESRSGADALVGSVQGWAPDMPTGASAPLIASPVLGPQRRPLRLVNWTARAVLNIALLLLTLALALPVVAEIVMQHEAPVGSDIPRTYPPLQQIGRRSFKIGNSSMRWRDAGDDTAGGAGIWQITLAGDPFQRGHAVAQLASPLDFRIETDMLDQLDSFLPAEWARWLVLRGVGANMATLPLYVNTEYKQEIWASATGAPDPHAYLAPSYPRILSYHALHDISQMLIDNPLIVPNSFACTGVVSLPAYSAPQNGGGAGHLFLARNFDFEGGESFSRQKSVTYIIPPPGQGIPFVHVAWPGLAGCVTGINAQHLAVFLNAAATSDHRRIGTPTILMARQILEHASSIPEAEKIIRRTHVFVSDIIVVADGKAGTARIFEKSPAATDFYDVQNSAVVTNHLITPRFKNDPVNKDRIADSTTVQRYTRARELLDAMQYDVTPPHLIALLRDKKAAGGKDIGLGNRNAIDGLIACHGVVIDATTGELWVAAWPHVEGPVLHFSLDPNAPETPPLPPDPIMTNGDWQRYLASTAAQKAALAALRNNDTKTAAADARAAIAANPNFYYGHEILGRALMQSGNLPAAKKEFTRSLELDPPYAKRCSEIQRLLQQCHPTR